jgi:hypothetical protein
VACAASHSFRVEVNRRTCRCYGTYTGTTGVRLYELNICEAVLDHGLCPGITHQKAGEIEARPGGLHLRLP